MSVQDGSYILIEECISDYTDEAELSNQKYWKLWHLAFRGMTILGLDFFYTVRSVKLPINDNMTVNLPGDYLNYSKIGVFNGKGEVIPLYYNSKLTTYGDLSPSRASKTEDNTLFADFSFRTPVFNNYWNGTFYAPIFGVPSGSPFVGDFKIDVQNNVILLSENFGYPYICLEYISSPVEGGEYRIPIQFKEALISYLAWTDIRSIPSSRRGNLGDKRDRRKEFFNDRRLARNRYKPFHIEQAYEENLRNQRLTVKG